MHGFKLSCKVVVRGLCCRLHRNLRKSGRNTDLHRRNGRRSPGHNVLDRDLTKQDTQDWCERPQLVWSISVVYCWFLVHDLRDRNLCIAQHSAVRRGENEATDEDIRCQAFNCERSRPEAVHAIGAVG